nr:hypothetical protein [uncultured Campylobacter sp.]
MIKVGIHIIQPVEIKIQTLLKIFELKIDSDDIKRGIRPCNIPTWKSTMDELYNLYNSIVGLNIDYEINFDKFCEEIEREEFNVNDRINISRYFKNGRLNVFLLFDYRLCQFIIIYELEILIPKNEVKEVTEYSQGKTDLYNCIRNIFVKENNNSLVLPCILSLKTKLCENIRNFIYEKFSLELPIDNFKIINNSGNITNVVLLDNVSANEYFLYSQAFLKLNFMAERNQNNYKPIELATYDEKGIVKDLYLFSGRFHTIIIRNTRDKYRYMPVQFQMQYLWFYLSKQINLILESYNDDILKDNSISRIVEYGDKIDVVINKIENLNIFNQKFKLSIEGDCKIYYEIEDRWNIENMIKSSNEYVAFFKDYLSRLYIKKSSKMDQRQNKILLFITLFQFIALLSVWNDYLALLNDELQKKAKGILPLFGSYENLGIFNLYLPIVFFVIILSMFIYIYRRKE